MFSPPTASAPTALFYYSPTREAEHPEVHLASYTGLCQADAYSGYNGLYAAGRKAGPIVGAACWGRTGGGSSSSWPSCIRH